jgi:hypothetical protein
MVQSDRSQITIRLMCTVRSNRHSEYVTLIAFPMQQWLHERALMLRLHVHCPSSLLRTAAVETVWCVKAFHTLLSKRRQTMTFSAYILGSEIKLSFVTSDAVAFCVTGTCSLISGYRLLRFI